MSAIDLKEKSDDISKAIGQLLVIVAESVRLTLEQQSIRRFEEGSLTKTEEDQLGNALFAISKKMGDLKELFGLDRDADAGLKLGNIDGVDLHLHEAINALLDTGLVIRGDASLGLGKVELANLNLMLHLAAVK